MINSISKWAKTTGLLASLAFLAACQTTTSSSPVAIAQLPVGPRVSTVAPTSAVATFINVCGKSLPKFASAKKRMRAAGISSKNPSGGDLIYSNTENLSFKIFPGKIPACSMVFGTKASRSSVFSVINSSIGPVKSTSKSTATVFRDTKALVIIRYTGRVEGIHFYNLVMTSER